MWSRTPLDKLPQPISGSETDFENPYRGQIGTHMCCDQRLHSSLNVFNPKNIPAFGDRVARTPWSVAASRIRIPNPCDFEIAICGAHIQLWVAGVGLAARRSDSKRLAASLR